MKSIRNFISESMNESDYKEQYDELTKIANEKSSAKHIITRFGKFCDYLQFIRFDALDEKDYPNHISDNSVFVEFEIDFRAKKVELHRSGHIWLSPHDKETDKYKYLAMRSMTSIAEEKGTKKFRKSNFKSIEDLYNKMENYYKKVMEAVTEYTGGYPYKEGK